INPHIALAHSAKAGALGRLAAKWASVPIIVYTPHAFPFLMGVAVSRRIAFAMIERMLGYITSALIAVSHSERGVALHERIISEDKVHVIENGIDVHRIHFDANARTLWRKRWQVPDDAFVIGCVADFRVQKGHEDLIRCIPLVLKQIKPATFVLVGRGEREAHLRQLCADLDVTDHVIFETDICDDWSIYSAFDVYALPSLWEGLPYTPLEAMACKVPVVVTDVVGNRDVVAPPIGGANGEWRAGLLVPPRNPHALARAIITLWEHEELRHRLSECGRRLVEKHFNVDRMVRQMEHLYEQLWSGMVQY
ncbi:MAG TPA: glycosyltransferase family 1 protein, partial [Armatimonadetes bacterium]|nr:glycosyltransferase family 1 protein [Armatimonadota bacterium]